MKGGLLDALYLTIPEMFEYIFIWTGKFVELSDLLRKAVKHSDEPQKLCAEADNTGALTFKAIRNSDRSAHSIDQWHLPSLP